MTRQSKREGECYQVKNNQTKTVRKPEVKVRSSGLLDTRCWEVVCPGEGTSPSLLALLPLCLLLVVGI